MERYFVHTILLLLPLLTAISCKGENPNNQNENFDNRHTIDSISTVPTVKPIRCKDVKELAVDSINVTIFGGGCDLCATFAGDSDIVEMRNVFGCYRATLSPMEHNLILASIDSLYISKSSKEFNKIIRVNDIEIICETPFIEIEIYKNGKGSSHLNKMDCFYGSTIRLSSRPFFNITNTLWTFNKRNCWEDKDYQGYSSPKEELISNLTRMYSPNPIPDYILNKIND